MRPRSTGSVDKPNIMDSIPNFMPSLGTANSGMTSMSLPNGPWVEMESIPRTPLPQDCWLYGDPSPRAPISYPILSLRCRESFYIRDHLPGTT